MCLPHCAGPINTDPAKIMSCQEYDISNILDECFNEQKLNSVAKIQKCPQNDYLVFLHSSKCSEC